MREKGQPSTSSTPSVCVWVCVHTTEEEDEDGDEEKGGGGRGGGEEKTGERG